MTQNRPEIECPTCNGNGWRMARWGFNRRVQLSEEDCRECNATGWRPMTDEEWNDWSADRYSDMCEGEPPLSLDEQHALAWKQKQELNR